MSEPTSEPMLSPMEADLHAHFDGQLDPARRGAVEAYLRAHPDEQARFEAYRWQRDALRGALGREPAILSLAPPPPAAPRQVRTRRRPGLWRLAASLAAGIVLGAAADRALLAPSAGGLAAVARDAAASYRVYARDAARPVEIAAGERERLIGWMSARLDRYVAPPDLSAAGYALLGGRLVATERGPAALFMFQDDQGERLTVFVSVLPRDQTTPLRPLEVAELDGCVWAERGLGYALIADESYRRLEELSRNVRAQAARSG